MQKDITSQRFSKPASHIYVCCHNDKAAGTIDTHRKNLLVKFDVNNTSTLIRKAMQLQFI
jgi:hypothetical protein